MDFLFRHVAVRVGNLQFIKLLLEIRPPIQVTVKNKQGLSPFSLAVQLGTDSPQTKIAIMAKSIVDLMSKLMPERIILDLVNEKTIVPRGDLCGYLFFLKNTFQYLKQFIILEIFHEEEICCHFLVLIS